MTSALPLNQWLQPSRPNDIPVAWLGQQVWTLGQLRIDVARLMEDLQHCPGQRWALCFDNSYLFVVALLALLGTNKTPILPGHCRLPLLQEQRAWFDGLLSDKTLAWDGTQKLVTSAQSCAAKPAPRPISAPGAYLELFTSGSTGAPKRVVKSIRALDLEAAWLAGLFGDRLADCKIVASVAAQHLYGLTFRIFLPLALGLPLHANQICYAEQLAALDQQQNYLFVSSPAFLKRLDAKLATPPLRLVFSAGGTLAQADAAATQNWFGIWPDEIYGSTETGVLAWRHRQQENTPWQLFSGVQIKPEGAALRAISPLIDTPEGVLLDDILRFDVDGRFQLVGRRGRIVKIEEKRISLAEVEQRLLALDGVLEAAALPVQRGARLGIGAVLVLNQRLRRNWSDSGSKKLELAWRHALLAWLEPVAVPCYWRVVEAIDVDSMNKRNYAQLQNLFHETA